MTPILELFLRCSEKGVEIGSGLRFVVLLLAGMVFSARGQTTTALQNDWANLTPLAGISATNSSGGDLNLSVGDMPSEMKASGTNRFSAEFAMVRYYKKSAQPKKAESILIGLLAADVPESVQKMALLQLADVVHGEDDLPRAESIYAQFLDRWPDDPRAPQVYMEQGEIFRQMGLTDLALNKFYSVMAAALSLKNDQFAYYQKLVLKSQVEIADTHYLMGHFVDAADFYNRLLQNPNPALDRSEIQFRLIRSLAIIGRNSEAVSQAQDFLSRYPDNGETPEVRYYLAQSLKALGRDNDALDQVLLCLKQQKVRSANDSAVWTYWQQRVGNEIGNQLYHEGDYVHALEIYADLAKLDSSAAWQVPVYYQMGLTYEKLSQPQKASDIYKQILAREAEAGTNVTPGMQAVFDMAKWRVDFLKWETNGQAADLSLAAMTAAETGTTNSTNNLTQ